MLLQEDADEDIGRRHRREQQMPHRHRRRRPERDDEAEIDRVPHEIVQHRRLEVHRRHGLAGEIVEDLVQAKQLEVVDHEGAGQDDQPAGKRKCHHRIGGGRIRDLPDHVRHGAPLPEQQDKREAGEQNVGATLDRFRHELQPPLLELRRAMTLCWIAKIDGSTRLTMSDAIIDPVMPLSMVLGTTMPSTKPIA